MRISDWSSDVCSSDLLLPRSGCCACQRLGPKQNRFSPDRTAACTGESSPRPLYYDSPPGTTLALWRIALSPMCGNLPQGVQGTSVAIGTLGRSFIQPS